MPTESGNMFSADYFNWLHSISDPRVKGWPLMSSHWPVLFIVLAYLGIVAVGPKFFRHRDGWTLRKLMIAYNLGVAALNCYICRETFTAATLLGYSYVCQKVVYSTNHNEMRIAKAIWWFFLSKIIELTDTIFLILRKKKDQLTFLHIYHHATMIVFWWIGAKWVAGGSAFFPVITNAAVHVLMYAYYGLSALGPNIQRFLWWKPYLTQIQMVRTTIIRRGPTASRKIISKNSASMENDDTVRGEGHQRRDTQKPLRLAPPRKRWLGYDLF